jgi:N-acetylmuramoyl-L-alanine amidase
MGPALSLLLAALLAANAGHAGGGASGAEPKKPAKRSTAARASKLEQARAELRALMRDPQRRRYHHNWERPIKGLLAAAQGAEAPAATLEAARARYALYRWSADEADRDEALRLAGTASRLGSKAASAFAAAVRREAGDERPARAAPAGKPRPPVPEEEGPPEPQLEAALADLKAPAPFLKLGESGGEGTATVAGVKTWISEDYTRVAIRLDHWVGWQPTELPAKGDSPRRVALDFRPARLDGAAVASAVPGEQVDRVRAAQHDERTVRVVLDLPGRHALHFYGLDDPPRLIVDVGTRRPTHQEAPAVADKPGEPPPQPEGSATQGGGEEAAEPRQVRRIVVDAGHGGNDPGAIGPTRVREKDVTLAMARKLTARLKAGGFEVVMTRSDDRYVALEERTAIANTQRGDLFISIHANANPRRALAGTETWILNVADDRYAKRLAARENGADPEGGGESSQAQRILTDLDAKASTDVSRRLAQAVQREITGAVRGRYGDDPDLGVKSALFYVLVGARMPAILVETAFISNRREEQRLASPAYQDLVAASLARAVEQFAHHDARVARAEPPRP